MAGVALVLPCSFRKRKLFLFHWFVEELSVSSSLSQVTLSRHAFYVTLLGQQAHQRKEAGATLSSRSSQRAIYTPLPD